MKRIKILVIAGGTYVSGAEKVTLNVIEGLKENGYDIHCMVSGWNNGDFISRIKSIGIPYTAIKLGWYYTSKIWWSLDSLVHYPKAIIEFLLLKKKFKADIVYTISFRQIVLLYPFFKKNIVYHIHDNNSHSRQSKLFLKLIDKKVIRYIAVSNFIKADIERCNVSPEKIEVVYNGVKILPALANKQLNVFSIGIVGQIIPRKGHNVLIDSLKILLDKGLDINLVIVGTGDKNFENDLKNKIAEYNIGKNIEWRGFVKNMEDIYQGIQVVIAPTLNEEPFGLMACEANMLGLPAIVSNKGGLPEIIENGVNGYTFNATDANELSEKILLLYNNPDLLRAMGENGREKVIQQFSIDKMVNSLKKIIQQLRL